MITVAMRKYQTSIEGKGTVKVKGKKITTSKTEVIPISDKVFLLDLIMALQIAWHSAEKIIKRKIKLMDKRKAYFIPVSVIPSINLFFAIIKATIKGAVTVTNDVIIGLNNFEISLSEIVPT